MNYQHDLRAAGAAVLMLLCCLITPAYAQQDVAQTEQTTEAAQSSDVAAEPERGGPESAERESAVVDPTSADSEDAAAEDDATDEDSPPRVAWDERVDRFEAAELALEAREDPDELYAELMELLRIRAYQFDLIIDESRSRAQPADSHVAELRARFPQADPGVLALPASVQTVQEAHENFLALYDQRIRLLEYVSEELRTDIMGTQLYGMQELGFEFQSIWLELRYQLIRIPAAGQQIMRMAKRAPLPLIWFVFYLSLLIFVFRWWRRWFPETIGKMRGYLMAVRPRTSVVLQRLRGIWYLERVRKPIEWLVFSQVFFGLIEFLELEFITEVSEIVVRWILFAWFAVVLLDAIVARGAGGTASESGKIRLRSLRLVAVWLVLLGLGTSLAERLTGTGALYGFVWRAFQLLAFPLAFALLGMWREELFRRVRREDRDVMSRAEFESQKGLAKYIGSAKLLGYLFANWLRRLFLRRMVELDSRRSGSTFFAEVEKRDGQPISAEQRAIIVDAAASATVYARSLRRELVQRIDSGIGGRVLVIGERGIGKDNFVRQVCADVDGECILLDGIVGTAADVERQLGEGLGISGPVNDREAVAAAVEEKNIRIIALVNGHMMVRPVMGGFVELQKFAELMEVMPTGIVRLIGMDRYAWQYIRCALGERATSIETVELGAWTDEQIVDLLTARLEQLEAKIDFRRIRVPSQYLDANEESYMLRTRKGLFVMAANLSGGNPSIAARLLAECLRVDENGRMFATLPANSDPRPVENSAIHVLLLLKTIAQGEKITRADIIANLRYPDSVVDNGLSIVRDRGWVGEKNGYYSLTWSWFRTITRVLSRQNLLAGLRQLP